MRIADTDILIQPGLDNSGEGHWQRRWAERFPNAHVIEQHEWHKPVMHDWVEHIAHDVMMATRPVVIVAHSLGVIAVAHAAAQFKDHKVRGAFLVSPPDLDDDSMVAKLPQQVRTFAPIPRDPLPFPSLLVASDDDPFVTRERAADMATAWGSEVHFAGPAGHINIASGHGPWPEGLLMFTRLMQRLRG
jgi:predicted alpha/beta hydrolase family esterase